MDTRTDPGQYYPGGRVMVRPDVAPPQMQVRWSDIQGKPDLSDVAELGEEATRGEMKQTMNTVINKLKTTLLIGALFVVGSAVADVEPLFAKADDIPGNQQVMTNAQEYIDAKVATIPAPDYSTNNAELVQTIQTKAPAPDFSTNNTELVGTIEVIVTNIPTKTSQLVNDGDGTNAFATVADIVLEPVYSDEPYFSDWEVFPVSDSYEPVGYPEYWNGEWFMYVYYPAWYGDYEAYGNTTDPNALYVEFVCDDIAPGLVVCTAKRSRIDIKGWTIGGNTNAVMQPAGDYAARAELQRVETNVVPRAARDATNYVNSATHLTPIWENAPPGTVDEHGMPVLGWFRGYKLGSQSTSILAATNYVGEVARKATTNAAKIAAMPGVVTNIVRDLSLGGIWDSQLEVWWTPRMRNGSLTYEATTNVNLNAGN